MASIAIVTAFWWLEIVKYCKSLVDDEVVMSLVFSIV
jgi:hypothetical protein